MSHLSILPTTLRDLDQCVAALRDLGHAPVLGGELPSFAGEAVPVVLSVKLGPDERLGWQRQPDGCLALVGDLQRLSRSCHLQRFLGALTRRYALRMAVQEASMHLPTARLQFAG